MRRRARRRATTRVMLLLGTLRTYWGDIRHPWLNSRSYPTSATYVIRLHSREAGSCWFDHLSNLTRGFTRVCLQPWQFTKSACFILCIHTRLDDTVLWSLVCHCAYARRLLVHSESALDAAFSKCVVDALCCACQVFCKLAVR